MAVSIINCCLRPSTATPAKEPTHLQPKQTAVPPWSAGLRRSCVAAAACIVIGTAGGMADGNDVVLARDMRAVDAIHGQTRWSDRRQCPPWRPNSLENVVPENLPRPSARRRFNSITAVERAPAVIPFSPLQTGMGCFSL